MACGHARQNGAGQHRLARHRLAYRDRGQCSGCRHTERGHGLADDVFAQHRPESGAAIAGARERRPSGALERQREGIAKAKGEGKYLGREPSIDLAEVRAMAACGMGPLRGAEMRGCGRERRSMKPDIRRLVRRSLQTFGWTRLQV